MTLEKASSHLELVARKDKKVSSSGVFKSVEQSALDACRQLVDHMFAATDDLFYELSKRASSNNEQNLYFETMREIRVKKDGLILSFLKNISNDFEDLLNGKNRGLKKDALANRSESDLNLSIVEGDDLEIELAQKSMSNRARESLKNELYDLMVRLDHLLLQTDVNEENNPLDPRQVSKAFVKTCVDKLKINIKTRLILFKLFEKHVLKQLGPVYSEANHTLIESGILPNVPKKPVKPARSDALAETESDQFLNASQSSSDRNAHTDAAAHATSNHFTSTQQRQFISLSPQALASLMAAVRRSTDPGVSQNYHAYAKNSGPSITVQDLTKKLTSKQPSVDHKIAGSEPKVVLRELVKALLAKNNPNSPSSLKQNEEDTINLVALFFDKILEDASLPIVVQSLICRLQIPVLKIALQDSSFLSNSAHPARQLINTITKAGIQFDDSKALERDTLYRAVADGVQLINRQLNTNEKVFVDVNSELESVMSKESRKATVVENRTNQTELGKAKIRNAKNFAQSTLFDKIKDEKLPIAISEFLTNTWLQVLVITFIKEGRDAAQWVENEQLVSDLIWLCKSQQDERSKARAQRMKPEILSRIETGLQLAIDNVETRKKRVAMIENTIDIIIGINSGENVPFRSLNGEQKEILGKAEGSEKSWEEMTALERQQSKYEELSSKFFLQAKEMQEGTWIEHHSIDGKILRCKLSKKIDADAYIFVNRLGFKVLEKSRRELAYDMQFNRVQILDSTPIFDRIMRGIVGHFDQKALSTSEHPAT